MWVSKRWAREHLADHGLVFVSLRSMGRIVFLDRDGRLCSTSILECVGDSYHLGIAYSDRVPVQKGLFFYHDV